MTFPPPPDDGLDLPAELVTGEAVALDLRTASFATRGLALLLDLLIQGILLVITAVAVGYLAANLDDAAAKAVGLCTALGIFVGLPVAVETLTRGRSVGKLAAGLRVVRDDGGPARFRQALIRGLLAVLEIYLTFGSVALITSLTNQRGKRVGDFLAGTYVIRVRGGAISPPPVMPPELAGWAAVADIGRIPDRLAVAVRQFLARLAGGRHHNRSSLDPAAQQRLALGLANQLAAYVAPPPPAGVSPERFLSAVLAERGRRDYARLIREQNLRLARQERRGRSSVLSPSSTRLVGED